MLNQLNRKRRTILNLVKTLALIKSLSANFAFLADHVSQVDLAQIAHIRAYFAPESRSGTIEIDQPSPDGIKTITISFSIDITEVSGG